MTANEVRLREENNRLVADATSKLVHIILQSRVVFSSGLFPSKDCHSFNLEIKLEHDVRTEISSWRQKYGALQNPTVPMAVDIYHTGPATPLNPHPDRTLLEHWTLRYESHLGGNRRAMDKERSLLQTAVMVRAIYSFLYVVPTADIVIQTRRHRGYGKLSFSLSSNPASHPFDTDDIESFAFGGVDTEFGTLHIDVIYRRDCSDLMDSSFLNSSLHYSNAPVSSSGRPRTASGIGLGHVVINDDYQAAAPQTPSAAVEIPSSPKRTTRPRTISLPQKPVPGQYGSFPFVKSSSIDRTMPDRREKRKTVHSGNAREWTELHRGDVEAKPTADSDIGQTEVLYSRTLDRQKSTPSTARQPTIVQEETNSPIQLRRAETTPSVYQHAMTPDVPYPQVLPGTVPAEPSRVASEAEETPFPEDFFINAQDALETSRLVKRSLGDSGKRQDRKHVDWADLRSDVSWAAAPSGSGVANPSVSPFKDMPLSAKSVLLRSRDLPKPSSNVAPLWASCVAPSETQHMQEPKLPRPPLSVSVSVEEDIASFIEACSNAPTLDMCTSPLKSHSLGSSFSSSGTTSGSWPGMELHHERVRQLHLFAEQLREVRRMPYGTT